MAAPDKGRACLEARAQRRSRPHEARHPCNWKAPLSASTQSGPIGIPSSRTGAELKGRDGCLEETAWECRSSTSLCLTRNKWDATLSAGPCPYLPWQLWGPHAPLLRPRLPQDSGGRTAEVAGGEGLRLLPMILGRLTSKHPRISAASTPRLPVRQLPSYASSPSAFGGPQPYAPAALCKDLPAQAVPICIEQSAGCSALLSINAAHLRHRVRRRDRNRKGRSPQLSRGDLKNTFPSQHREQARKAPCQHPQPQRAAGSPLAPCRFPVLNCIIAERKQESGCSHWESSGRVTAGRRC